MSHRETYCALKRREQCTFSRFYGKTRPTCVRDKAFLGRESSMVSDTDEGRSHSLGAIATGIHTEKGEARITRSGDLELCYF